MLQHQYVWFILLAECISCIPLPAVDINREGIEVTDRTSGNYVFNYKDGLCPKNLSDYQCFKMRFYAEVWTKQVAKRIANQGFNANMEPENGITKRGSFSFNKCPKGYSLYQCQGLLNSWMKHMKFGKRSGSSESRTALADLFAELLQHQQRPINVL